MDTYQLPSIWYSEIGVAVWKLQVKSKWKKDFQETLSFAWTSTSTSLHALLKVTLELKSVS